MTAPDADVIAALRARDEATYAELVDRYSGSMLRVARTFVPSAAIAEEVVQDAWIGVLKGIDQFEGRSSLKTWIFSILANIARTRGQREAKVVPFASLARAEADGDERAVDPDRFLPADDPEYPRWWDSYPEPWPEQRLLDGETRAVAEAAIATLPPAQRAVITLRDINGLDSEEVCNALGLSQTNQRVLLHRARSKVRGALERYLDEDRT